MNPAGKCFCNTASASVTTGRRTFRAPLQTRYRPSKLVVKKHALLHYILDMLLAQAAYVTHVRLLRGQQELVETHPSTRLPVTAARSRKEYECTASVKKVAVVNMIAKRK